jgi:hypothetical protein
VVVARSSCTYWRALSISVASAGSLAAERRPVSFTSSTRMACCAACAGSVAGTMTTYSEVTGTAEAGTGVTASPATSAGKTQRAATPRQCRTWGHTLAHTVAHILALRTLMKRTAVCMLKLPSATIACSTHRRAYTPVTPT